MEDNPSAIGVTNTSVRRTTYGRFPSDVKVDKSTIISSSVDPRPSSSSSFSSALSSRSNLDTSPVSRTKNTGTVSQQPPPNKDAIKKLAFSSSPKPKVKITRTVGNDDDNDDDILPTQEWNEEVRHPSSCSSSAAHTITGKSTHDENPSTVVPLSTSSSLYRSTNDGLFTPTPQIHRRTKSRHESSSQVVSAATSTTGTYPTVLDDTHTTLCRSTDASSLPASTVLSDSEARTTHGSVSSLNVHNLSLPSNRFTPSSVSSSLHRSSIGIGGTITPNTSNPALDVTPILTFSDHRTGPIHRDSRTTTVRKNERLSAHTTPSIAPPLSSTSSSSTSTTSSSGVSKVANGRLFDSIEKSLPSQSRTGSTALASTPFSAQSNRSNRSNGSNDSSSTNDDYVALAGAAVMNALQLHHQHQPQEQQELIFQTDSYGSSGTSTSTPDAVSKSSTRKTKLKFSPVSMIDHVTVNDEEDTVEQVVTPDEKRKATPATRNQGPKSSSPKTRARTNSLHDSASVTSPPEEAVVLAAREAIRKAIQESVPALFTVSSPQETVSSIAASTRKRKSTEERSPPSPIVLADASSIHSSPAIEVSVLSTNKVSFQSPPSDTSVTKRAKADTVASSLHQPPKTSLAWGKNRDDKDREIEEVSDTSVSKIASRSSELAKVYGRSSTTTATASTAPTKPTSIYLSSTLTQRFHETNHTRHELEKEINSLLGTSSSDRRDDQGKDEDEPSTRSTSTTIIGSKPDASTASVARRKDAIMNNQPPLFSVSSSSSLTNPSTDRYPIPPLILPLAQIQKFHQRLLQQWPGRDESVATLTSLFQSPIDVSYAPIIVYGRSGTGKSTVIHELLENTSMVHSFLRCVGLYTYRNIYEQTLSLLANSVLNIAVQQYCLAQGTDFTHLSLKARTMMQATVAQVLMIRLTDPKRINPVAGPLCAAVLVRWADGYNGTLRTAFTNAITHHYNHSRMRRLGLVDTSSTVNGTTAVPKMDPEYTTLITSFVQRTVGFARCPYLSDFVHDLNALSILTVQDMGYSNVQKALSTHPQHSSSSQAALHTPVSLTMVFDEAERLAAMDPKFLHTLIKLKEMTGSNHLNLIFITTTPTVLYGPLQDQDGRTPCVLIPWENPPKAVIEKILYEEILDTLPAYSSSSASSSSTTASRTSPHSPNSIASSSALESMAPLAHPVLYRSFVHRIIESFYHLVGGNISELRYLIGTLWYYYVTPVIINAIHSEDTRALDQVSIPYFEHMRSRLYDHDAVPSTVAPKAKEALVTYLFQFFRDTEKITGDKYTKDLQAITEPILSKLHANGLPKEVVVASTSSSLSSSLSLPINAGVSSKLTGLATGTPKEREIEYELPLYYKFLLVAAFAASHNPPEQDIRYFSRNNSGRTKKRQTNDSQIILHQNVLEGPRPFTLERLYAIFHSFIGNALPETKPQTPTHPRSRSIAHANLYDGIQTLIDLHLLQEIHRSSHTQQQLKQYEGNSLTREFIAHILPDTAMKIANNINIELGKYLYEPGLA